VGTLTTVLTLIVAAIAIIGAAAAVVVFVRGSYGAARINALREDNTDLRARVDDSDKELLKCKGREEALEARVIALERENEFLNGMVTKAADVESLRRRQDEYYQELTAMLERILIALEAGSSGQQH